MRTERTVQIVNRLLQLSLIFLIVYMVFVTLFTAVPKLFGMYDLPFDLIHFGTAAVKTLIIAILCAAYKKQVSQDSSGGSFGFLLIVSAYFTGFLIDWVSGIIYSYQLSYWVSTHRSEIPVGQNISTASYISNFCGYADVFFFTAVGLLIAAYAIWHTHCKLKNE